MHEKSVNIKKNLGPLSFGGLKPLLNSLNGWAGPANDAFDYTHSPNRDS
jgi:hypothetical protein